VAAYFRRESLGTISEMMIFDIFDIAPLHNVAQAPVGIVPPVHRMRVQLQDDTMKKNHPHTFGVARSANASTGVKRLHMRNAMKELYQDVGIRAAWFPLRFLPQLVSAIIRISQKLDQYPPGGTQTSGNIERITFLDHGIQYRLDIENLFGHNLRS
jgi:hypothetical protein